MDVLVTGASGLLGTDIVLAFESNGDNVIKACHRERDGYLAVDLSSESELKVLEALKWDVVVHCAAWRDPDNCAVDNEGAKLANIVATENIAKLAKSRSAKVIYISTDYVFPGTDAPYSEDDKPNPINFYGKTKLGGEKIVLNSSPSNVSLRIPALYGISAGIERASMLLTSLKIMDSPEESFILDDVIVKYPTFTGDVANAVIAIIHNDASGVFHCSGNEKMSKYKIHLALCRALGRDDSNVSPSLEYSESAQRPIDSHLSTKRLDELNPPSILPFEERISKLACHKTHLWD